MSDYIEQNDDDEEDYIPWPEDDDQALDWGDDPREEDDEEEEEEEEPEFVLDIPQLNPDRCHEGGPWPMIAPKNIVSLPVTEITWHVNTCPDPECCGESAVYGSPNVQGHVMIVSGMLLDRRGLNIFCDEPFDSQYLQSVINIPWEDLDQYREMFRAIIPSKIIDAFSGSGAGEAL